MWTISRSTGRLLVLAAATFASPVMADSNYNQNNQQFGLNLPQVTLPSGSDEIRTTDGSTCRSAVGGDGAYLDVGVLGTPENQDINGSAAAYGRLIIPLGAKSTRLDCSKLYNLEIARLKMELELARMGASGTTNTAQAPMNSNWAEEGWGNQPAAIVQPVAAPKPASKATKKSKRQSPLQVDADYSTGLY